MADPAPRLRVVCATASQQLRDEISAALSPPISRPFLVGGHCEPALGLRSRLGGGYTVEWAAHGAEPAWLVLGARRDTLPVAVVVLDAAFKGSGGVEATLRALWSADPHLEVVLYASPGDPIPPGIVREADEGGQVVVLRQPVEPIDLVLAVGSAAGRWSLREQLAETGRGRFAVQAALQLFRPGPEASRAAASLADIGLALEGPTERILDGAYLLRDALESYGTLTAAYRSALALACADKPHLRRQARAAEEACDLAWLSQSQGGFVDAIADSIDYVRTAAHALKLLASQPHGATGYSDVNASIAAAVQDIRDGSERGDRDVEILTDLREVPAAHCPVLDLRALLRDAIHRTADTASSRGGRRVVVTTRRNSSEVVVEIGSESADSMPSSDPATTRTTAERSRPIRIRLPIEPTTSWSP
ncbi:MAG: hypothetical protein R3F39_05860 [Myxococcota bacterium]